MIKVAGSINVTVYVYFVDDDGGTAPGEPTTGLLFSNIETGGSASFVRTRETRTDFALVTVAIAAAHTDGGFIEVDATNMPGLYRLDLTDAACAAAADEDHVIIQLVAAIGNNTVMRPLLIDLIDFNVQSATPDTNATQIAGNASAATQLALSGVQIISGAFVGVPTTTVLDTDLGDTQTNTFQYRSLVVTSGVALNESRAILSYNGTTKELTTVAFAIAPAAADTFIII